MARLDRTSQEQKPAPKPQPTPKSTSARPPQKPTPIFTDYASI
ncbi:hypothetical protein [Sulfitobacter delicatus]|uniref:Uncharacterized protein n=1 Tax=Sulfitobacter delicatus TaxID=218672 RepID=A0A1G7QPG4_9RHOB|nr:hypothetical protein [Sulfitobacter delicatus]SDG00388.1 hypothetical protein SAMN04489759_104130 [Sulfitobacter delicatus]